MRNQHKQKMSSFISFHFVFATLLLNYFVFLHHWPWHWHIHIHLHEHTMTEKKKMKRTFVNRAFSKCATTTTTTILSTTNDEDDKKIEMKRCVGRYTAKKKRRNKHQNRRHTHTKWTFKRNIVVVVVAFAAGCFSMHIKIKCRLSKHLHQSFLIHFIIRPPKFFPIFSFLPLTVRCSYFFSLLLRNIIYATVFIVSLKYSGKHKKKTMNFIPCICVAI